MGKSDPMPLGGVALLAVVTIFWGVNWPYMKIVVSEIPVWWFRTFCLWFAAGGMLLAAKLSGSRATVTRAEVWPLILLSVFAVLGWHLFSGYGISLMPAGRASTLAFTMPVWAAMLSVWLLDERLSAAKLIGLALGLAGIAVLLGPDLIAFQTAPWGALLMIGAAMSWAAGTVLIKRYTWKSSSLTLVGWQQLIGAPVITAGALIIDPMPDWATVSPEAWGSLAFVLLLPILFCQWAYFRVVQMLPATTAAIGTLAIPVVGSISGAVILDEALGPREISALVLICSALASVMILPNLRRKAPAGAG